MSVTPATVPTRPLTVAERPPGERYHRHPGDVLRLVGWASATLVLLLLVELAPATVTGWRTDVGALATDPPTALRQLVLTGVQLAALVVPVAVLATLAVERRFRRIATLLVAAAAGVVATAAVVALGPSWPATPAPVDAWVLRPRFPSPVVVGAAVAVAVVAAPWRSRRWRRADLVVLAGFVGGVAVAGAWGAPELAAATLAGGLAGSAVLVALGAPNRLPTVTAIVAALVPRGMPDGPVALVRVAVGRALLFRGAGAAGGWFLKVYGQDSRDADVLYRGYRRAVLREPGERTGSLRAAVEHEALVLLLAERAGVRCPSVLAVAATADGSMVLAMSEVDGGRLDEVPPGSVDDDLLRAVWAEVARLHGAGLAHGALRAANVLVDATGRPVVIDLGAGTATADDRTQALDRAELLVSLAALVGPEAAVRSAAAVLPAPDLAASLPYLQPLALSAATRRAASRSALQALRDGVSAATGCPPVALERLVRVRPRTLVMFAALAGAFYVLLPQLAHVDESVAALGSANWGWLAAAVVTSGLTYVFAAVGMLGGIRVAVPFVPTVQVALASSFVNRVTPANVGGMALNVRYLQRAGVPPAEAVTGVGLNVVAGGIVHLGLLAVFLTWSRRDATAAFAIPSSSTLLVVVAVVLAVVGLVLATRRGRGLARAHVLPPIRQSLTSIRGVARSPWRLAALFGGSVGVTLAYVAALSCAVTAFDGGVAVAQVGAVYLGASLIAAAAPTPGGLGALEAALVAGLTGVGMDPGLAVAAVLSYRLLTFWLPVLPGWICFHLLERRRYI